MSANSKLHIYTIVILTIVFALFADASGQKRGKSKIILDHADTTRSNGSLRTLIGNVRIRRGDMTLQADRALYDSESGLLNLSGRVQLDEPGQRLTSKRISYYEDTGDYECAGDVNFNRADSIHIKCELARYTEYNDILNLYNNVFIQSMSDSSTITGERGQWIKGEETAIVEGNPVYRLPDKKSTPADTLIINSKKIKFFRQNNSALFTGEVELEMRDLLAVADSLFHYPDSGYTDITGAPVIWRGKDQLSGHRIQLFTENNDLKKIQVNGEAIVLSEAHENDERRNRLSGRILVITMTGEDSRLVQVEGDAEGEYHVWDETDIYKGVNLSAADVIEITISDDKVKNIKLEGSTSGAFYPPEMAPDLTRESTVPKVMRP